jgi:hypothetical protein
MSIRFGFGPRLRLSFGSRRGALTSGVLAGFCASVTAYEDKYLDGQEQGDACLVTGSA